MNEGIKEERELFYDPRMETYVQEGLEKDFPELKGKIHVALEATGYGRASWRVYGYGERPETKASDEEINARFGELVDEAYDRYREENMSKKGRMKCIRLSRKEAVNFSLYFHRQQEKLTQQDAELMLMATVEENKTKRRKLLIRGLNDIITFWLKEYAKEKGERVTLTKEERHAIIFAYLHEYERAVEGGERVMEDFFSKESEKERKEFLESVMNDKENEK